MAESNERTSRGATTRVTNCTSPSGTPTSVETEVTDDRLIELRVAPGSIARLTPEAAAQLRGQLADGIADSLQGVRWKP